MITPRNQNRYQDAMTLVGEALRKAELPSSRDEVAVLVLSMVVAIERVRADISAASGKPVSRGQLINIATELLRSKLQQNLRRP